MPAKLPNENLYPAHTRPAPTAAARQKGNARSSARRATTETAGRSLHKYHPSAAPNAAGMNASEENLERTARPRHAPNRMLWSRLGFSSHTIPERKLAPTKAVSAMSVVARPACARMGGRKVNKKNRRHRNQTSEVLPAPRINHQSGNPEEWKDSQAGQRQVPIVVVVAVEDERPFLVHVAGPRRPAAAR